jgi:hypothetical protein
MIAAVWIATYMTEYVPFSGLGAELRYRTVLALPWIAGGLTLGTVAGWLVVTKHPYRWAFFLALIVACADAFTLRNIHPAAVSIVLKAAAEVVLGAGFTWVAFVRIARRAHDSRPASGVAG